MLSFVFVKPTEITQLCIPFRSAKYNKCLLTNAIFSLKLSFFLTTMQNGDLKNDSETWQSTTSSLPSALILSLLIKQHQARVN